MHKTPGARHIEACKPWMQAEILMIEPQLIVCLGATAAKALLGRQFRVSRQRGQFVEMAEGLPLLATHHPAAILRAPRAADRENKRNELIADLVRVADRMASSGTLRA
jgi:uracil-DNA glycosylase